MISGTTNITEFKDQKFSDKAIGWVATLWGCCIVLPVGMQYLCLFLLLIFMLLSGRSKIWVRNFREEKMWACSAALFVGITLLSLTLQDKYYKETPANLWHGLRIVLTLMIGLSLRANEARKAILAAFVSVCIMGILVIMQAYGWLQGAPKPVQKLIPSGNEWIWMSILMSMLIVAAVRSPFHRSRLAYFGIACLAAFAILINIKFMNQRSGHLAVAIGLIAVLLAFQRSHPFKLALNICGLVALMALAYHQSSSIHTKFMRGFTEINEARQGVIKATDSMNIRYNFTIKTADMLSERPLLGWGIGSWNDQWKQRADPSLHQYNMPHNDFLWMGAQAGIPGAMAWLFLMLSLCWMAWKRHQVVGHMAFAWAWMALACSLVNSGTRDAALGLPMLFLVAACLAWAKQNESDLAAPKQRIS
jgi:O-antigen ligase